jgi:hypothetical protein
MLSRQIINELEQAKQQGKEFIKWWRRENDFVDYETIDHYVETPGQTEIENFELLDRDQMWDVLKTWKSSGLRRTKSLTGGMIEWQHTGKDGQAHTYTCPYNAESIMSIFDVETRGNTIS